MSKHTPGPWTTGERSGIYGNGERLAVIQWCINPEKPFDVCDEEAQANARLMAAAPDMLEALEGVAHYIKKMPGMKLEDFQDKYIQAAIDKARGRNDQTLILYGSPLLICLAS